MTTLIETARSRRMNALAARKSYGDFDAIASGSRRARLNSKGAELIAKAREGRLNALKALGSRCDNIFSDIYAEAAVAKAPASIKALPLRTASAARAQRASLPKAA